MIKDYAIKFHLFLFFLTLNYYRTKIIQIFIIFSFKDNELIVAANGQYYTTKDGALNGLYHVELRGHAISSSHNEYKNNSNRCDNPVLPVQRAFMSLI